MENKINTSQIAGAILIVGIIIAGAILLRGKAAPTQNTNNGAPAAVASAPAPVTAKDHITGNPQAKLTFVAYEDFQCVYCGAVSGLQPNSPVIKPLLGQDPTWIPYMPIVMNYVNKGDIEFVYRDFAFLGPESTEASEAADCASDQGKYWEYHDYLFAHQNGENQGAFSNPNLETFAKSLGLQTATFNQCLESGKYAQAVADSKTEGIGAGITGTPHSYILKDGKVVADINGAESGVSVTKEIEDALK